MQPLHCLAIKMILIRNSEDDCNMCNSMTLVYIGAFFSKYARFFNRDLTTIIRSKGNTSHKLANNLLLPIF